MNPIPARSLSLRLRRLVAGSWFSSARHLVLGLVLLAASGLGVSSAHAQVGSPDLSVMNLLRDNFGWEQAFGWPQGTNPAPGLGINWPGVAAGSGRVTQISVTAGAVKPVQDLALIIGSLSNIQILEVRNAYPTRPAAMENFDVLNSLIQLRRLRYDQNAGLDGTLDALFPAAVAVLPNLTLLNLGGTSFTGTIPAGAFAAGRSTHLNQAKFAGLPGTGILAATSEARVAGNRLTGVVPAWLLDPPAGAVVRLGYNALDIHNTPPGALDTLDPGWRATQTVPPTGVQVTAATATTATLGWTPIAYTAHGGHYAVLGSETAGGPYTALGTTAASGGKTASSLTVGGLTPGATHHFVVRTFTPAHTGGTSGDPANLSDNPNDLTSAASAEVTAVAEAPSLIVTTTADVVNDIDNQTSLREALGYAATLSGPQTVTFSNTTANGAVNFHDGAARTIVLGGTELAVTGSVTLTGPGAERLSVDGNDTSRVFQVASGTTVAMSGLTVTRGRAPDGVGAVVPASRGAHGGGILNAGDLTLTGVTVTANRSGSGTAGVPSGGGGGIYSSGALTLAGCTVSLNTTGAAAFLAGGVGAGVHCLGRLIVTGSSITGNVTGSHPNGGPGDVGGVFATGDSSFTDTTIRLNRGARAGGAELRGIQIALTRCTIAENTAQGGGSDTGGLFISGVPANGAATLTECTISGNPGTFVGGIRILQAANRTRTVDLRHCTLSGNTGSTADGIFLHGGTQTNLGTVVVRLSHTILAQAGASFGRQGSGGTETITSLGYNVASDSGGDFLTAAGDQTNVSAASLALGPLQNNGGPTATRALLPGSVALDAGDPAFDPNAFTPPLTTDQRGQARVSGSRVDIGAVEAGQVSPTLQLSRSSFATDDSSTVTSATPAGGTFTVRDAGNAVVAGVLNGTTLSTSTAGAYTLSYTVTSADGIPATATVPFTVVAPLAVGVPASIPPYWVDTATFAPIQMPITGGVGLYTIVAGATTLPPGMLASVSNGNASLLFGQRVGGLCPPTAGTFSSTVTVEDANGRRAARPLVIFVSAENPIEITTAANTVVTLFPDGGGGFLFRSAQSGTTGFRNRNRIHDNPGSNVQILSFDTVPAIAGGLGSLFTFQLVPDGLGTDGIPRARMNYEGRRNVALPAPGTYQTRLDYQYFGVFFSDENVSVVVLGPRSLGAPTRTSWTENRPGFTSALPIGNAPPGAANFIRVLTGCRLG